jgi:hypothetical protein
VPPAAGPTEISKITFDDEARMYLAERPAPTGAQDFEALSVPSIGRVLRYTVIGVTATKQPIWQTSPDEYAVGFPENFRNDNGGVAIGYSYDIGGNMNPRSCGGFVWTTGEQLRHATDPKLAAQLGQQDALAIDGLQGSPVWRIRRDNEPPRISYFIDYADAPPDPSARGHMGDVAILRRCKETSATLSPGLRPAATRPSSPNVRICQTHVCAPDGSVCPVNQVWSPAGSACTPGCAPTETLVNGKCCSQEDMRAGGACSPSTDIGKPMCGVTQTAIGPKKECCENNQIYSGPNGEQLCCATALVNGKCGQLIPKFPELQCANCCASGYVPIGGKCCLKSQATSTGQCCPIGKTPSSDGTLCVPLNWLPKLSLCCASGFVPTGKGKCCASANLTTSGECCPSPVDPNDRRQCLTQTKKKSAAPEPCSRGEVRDSQGACVRRGQQTTPSTTGVPVMPIRPTKCQPDERRDARGVCVARKPKVTPEGPAPNLARPIACPPGWVLGPLGKRCLPAGRGQVAPRLPASRPIHRPGLMMPR